MHGKGLKKRVDQWVGGGSMTTRTTTSVARLARCCLDNRSNYEAGVRLTPGQGGVAGGGDPNRRTAYTERYPRGRGSLSLH